MVLIGLIFCSSLFVIGLGMLVWHALAPDLIWAIELLRYSRNHRVDRVWIRQAKETIFIYAFLATGLFLIGFTLLYLL